MCGVHQELSRIKQQFNQPDASVERWCESFPEIIFCAMLGYDVSFCHIHIVKLAAGGKGVQKRVGYLAATLLLDPTCPITILMTGTLYKDLMSSNMLDNLMALSTAAELISAEHIPMMLPPVVKLLRHRQSMVRAKAVYCMHAFFHRAPTLLQSHVQEVKGMLGDRDPAVLMAVVTALESLLGQNCGERFSDLTLPLVNIMQQIRAYKFPALFSYHGLPLPWLQVKLLKILARVTPQDDDDDDILTSVIALLSQVVRDTVSKETMSLAILEESLTTIAVLASGKPRRVDCTECEDGEKNEDGDGPTMLPDESRGLYGDEASSLSHAEFTSVQRRADGEEERTGDRAGKMLRWKPLLEEASRCVGSFLGADLPNMRYIGIKLLTRLVSVSADSAVAHKDKVVHCLNDPDLIIRRQTLTLLQHMAVADNFKAVCGTMLKHAQKGGAMHRADVIAMVMDISRRLNSDPEWYLHTIFPLLSWQLDDARLHFIMDGMLTFFIKTSQGGDFPQFPDLLLATVMDNVVQSEGRADPSVEFSLYVLRFIPLPACKTFPSEMFLEACSKLVSCDSQTGMDLKKETVLCVEALLLRGVLDTRGVSTWAANWIDKVDAATAPYTYRFCLMELSRLASVCADLTPLPEVKPLWKQSPPEKMDFSLSFLDSSVRTAVQENQHGQPFLKKFQPPGEREVPVLLPQQGAALSVSAKSEEVTSSVPSHDGSPLYVDLSVWSELGKDSGTLSPSGVLKTAPGAKQRWSRQGFDNSSASEGRSLSASASSSDNTTDDGQTLVEDAGKDHKDDNDELTQALFQGLSPPTSVTSVLRPTSKAFTEKSSSSSGFDSSSSQNSAGTSGQNTPLPGGQDGDSRWQTAVTGQSQYSVLPSGPELDANSEGIAASSASNSWKMLHTAHTDEQTTSNAEQDQLPSPVGMADGASSNIDSQSHLSISDDSLENAGESSPPNSPTQQTPQSQESLFQETGREESSTDETVLSLFLESQMMENEIVETEQDAEGDVLNTQTQVAEEENPQGEFSGEDNLYSGFELLTDASKEQDCGDIEPDALVRHEQQT
ncbi:hypothetical protein ACOMHN_013651 [Nucella lapillus]